MALRSRQRREAKRIEPAAEVSGANALREYRKALLMSTGHYAKPRPLFSRHEIQGGELSLLPAREHLLPFLRQLPKRIPEAEHREGSERNRIVKLSDGKNEKSFLVRSLRERWMAPWNDLPRRFRRKAKKEMSSENEARMNWEIRTELGIRTETPIGFAVIGGKQYAIFAYHPEIDKKGSLSSAREEYASKKEVKSTKKRLKRAGFRFAFDSLHPRHMPIDRTLRKPAPRLIDTESVYRKRKRKRKKKRHQ